MLDSFKEKNPRAVKVLGTMAATYIAIIIFGVIGTFVELRVSPCSTSGIWSFCIPGFLLFSILVTTVITPIFLVALFASSIKDSKVKNEIALQSGKKVRMGLVIKIVLLSLILILLSAFIYTQISTNSSLGM